MGIILKPFAMLLLFFYNLLGSYGGALILFAVVIKTILFPVTLMSKKSMVKTSMLSEKMQKLQKQYGKDKERYNLEVQKLYEREKVNPMGGCLWSLVPMIVLIALYGVIRQPMTYFMNLSMEQIQVVAAQLDWQTVAVANKWVSESAMNKLVEQVAAGDIASVFQNGNFNQIYLSSLINDTNLETLRTALGEAGKNLVVLNFSFLGLNLNDIPNWKVWQDLSWNGVGLFLLAVLSAVTSFVSMKVSMATNNMNNAQAQNAQADTSNKVMMVMMPLMSLWLGFTLPAALSVYWIAQYLVTMVQEVICGQLLKKDYAKAREASERREQEEKEEEKRRKEEARLARQRRIEEEKANRGKKKKTALKKDDEPEQEGVNKEDSREGLRAYARGRAYIPDRFGAVTPYADPDVLAKEEAEAADANWGDKNKNKDNKKEKKKKKKQGEQPEKTEELKSLEGPGKPEEAGKTEEPPRDGESGEPEVPRSGKPEENGESSEGEEPEK